MRNHRGWRDVDVLTGWIWVDDWFCLGVLLYDSRFILEILDGGRGCVFRNSSSPNNNAP